MSQNLTHVTGCFLIPATGSFLNGAGLAPGEDRNVATPKSFRSGGQRVPYVSAQAWRRWLRNTLIEETGWQPSELTAIELSAKGTTNKISGKLDPVDYPEDDIFGYMMAEKGQGSRKVDEEPEATEDEEAGSESEGEETAEKRPKPSRRVKSVMRASPFMSSLLVSIKGFGWLERDEGFVHLKEGTPLPYTTEFYNTHLQGVFCLNYSRLGVFSNIGDRIEISQEKVSEYLRQNKIRKVKDREVYELVNADGARKERATAVIRALAVLRGGAKQAAFGTPVEPQALVLAGLSCGNPIFHHLFRMNSEDKGPELKVSTLKEIITDYKARIVTPVFVGIRSGYCSNEDEIRSLKGEVAGVNVDVVSPLQAAEGIASSIISLKP